MTELAAPEQAGQSFLDFVPFVIAAVGLAVVGLPALVLGVVVAGLDGEYRAVAPGAVVLIGAGTVAWIAVGRARNALKRLAAPRRRNTVFISYRTAEHAAEAERIADLLRDSGYGVRFFAKGATSAATAEGAFYRKLGLFQLGELDYELQSALNESDAVVYLVPEQGPRSPLGLSEMWTTAKDAVDGLVSGFLFMSGMTKTAWRWLYYSGVFGVSLPPPLRMLASQTWQQWELLTARGLGLAVVKVRFAEGPIADADPELVALDMVRLDRDLSTEVLPRLRSGVRPGLPPRGVLTPTALAVFLVAAIAVAATLAVVATGAFLLVHFGV